MSTTDKNNQDAAMVTPELDKLKAGTDLALFFIESVRNNKLVKKVRSMPYAQVTFNPIQYIDLILGEVFGGNDGANLKKYCADADGRIDPQKLLQTLKDTFKRIVDTLKSPTYTNFFHQNPEYGKATLAQEYQKVFRYLAAMYGVGEEFEQFAYEEGVLENRTVEQKQADSEKPAEPPRRITQSWAVDAAKRSEERGIQPVPGQMRVGNGQSPTPTPGKRETLRMPAVPQPASQKKHTLQLVSGEDGEKHVAGYKPEAITHEVIRSERRSSIPLPAVIDEIRRRHTTLQGMPTPSLESLTVEYEASPQSLRRKADKWILQEDEEAETGEISEPPRSSLHSFNPPPPTSDSDDSKLVDEISIAMAAMERLANEEFKHPFIRAYRVLALKQGIKDTMDQRYVGMAIDNVLKKAMEIDGSDAEAPLKNFRSFYCATGMDAEKRKLVLTAVAKKVLMEDLPGLKSLSYNQLRKEFISDFQGRYPVEGDKTKRSEMFLPTLDDVVEKLNKRLKEDRENFESYSLYYPSGHMAEVRERAMAIAAENAGNQLANLEVPVEAYLTMNRKYIEKDIVGADEQSIEDLVKAVNWFVLEWLYKQLPKEKGPRIWLTYYFQGQTRPEKLQVKEADEKLEIIGTHIYQYVQEYCDWLRGEASASALAAPETKESADGQVDIKGILGNDGDAANTDAEKAAAFSPEANSAVLRAPVKSIIISDDIDPAHVTESVASGQARPRIEKLNEFDRSELDTYGMVRIGDWKIMKTDNGYAFEDDDGKTYYEHLPSAGPMHREEAVPQLADLSTMADDLADTGSETADNKSVSDGASQVAGMTESDYVVRLEVPPTDQKAQEFNNLLALFASQTDMRVSRGPMGSMPPGPNEDGIADESAPVMPEPYKIPAKAPDAAPMEKSVVGNAGSPYPMVPPVLGGPFMVASYKPATERTEDESSIPMKKPSWLAKLAAGAALVATMAGGAVGIYYGTRSNTDSTQEPQTASSVDTNKGPQSASSSMAKEKAPETPKTVSPEKAATDKGAVTPEMIASVKNPELKKVMESGRFEVKANGGGYGQQIRAFFDAEINFKVKAGEITPQQAAEMTQRMNELQNKVNTGAALSYYEKYSKLSYGEVYAKRANPGKDSLFAYLDRNNNNAGMGNWESWRSKYEPLTRMAGAQEAKQYFEEKYEKAFLNFAVNSEYSYDQRAHGNIHWGAHGGDKRLVQNEKGEWLPYFADMANIVLKGTEKPVEIDLDLDTLQDNQPAQPGVNGAPTVNPDNNSAPEVTPWDGGTRDNGTIDGGFGKTGMLNHRNDPDDDPTIEVTGYTESDDDSEIEVTWTDVEDPEVTVGEEVEIDIAELEDDPEITVGETDIDLSDLEEAPKKPAVTVTSSTLSKKLEEELAELEDGWFTEPAKAPEVKAPTLDEKIAAVKKNRKEALLERGEVFVPSLSEDLDGSVKLAFENGFLMMCSNGIQQDKVETLARNIRFSEMVEYEATEKGTYARLSPEKLAQLRDALNLEEAPKNEPAVTVKPATYGEAMEAELAEIEEGWLDLIERVEPAVRNPMDVQYGIRTGLKGVMKEAA
jgi:hypothetical protein